ncbi:MAG: general secretion pathway protein GspB [Nitrospirota bacterium]
MSFILDALKKLEQKRQQSAVPDLLTVHYPDPVKPEKRPIWPYLILSALFLNAVVLTVWLRPWNSEKHSIANEPTVVKQANEDSGIHQQVSTSFTKAEDPDLPLQKPEAGIKKSSPVSAKTAAKPVSEPALNVSRKEPLVNTVRKEEPSAAKEAPDTGSKSLSEIPTVQEKTNEVTYNYQTASGESIPALEELPQTLRQEMPEITVSGHIYSDSPSSRLVNINGSIRREGDMVAAGIKLIEITDSGVILSYKDLRFYLRGF